MEKRVGANFLHSHTLQPSASYCHFSSFRDQLLQVKSDTEAALLGVGNEDWGFVQLIETGKMQRSGLTLCKPCRMETLGQFGNGTYDSYYETA